MKNLRFNTNFLESNIFKNSVITFGMCLSLFTITSFDTISGKEQSSKNAIHATQSLSLNHEQTGSDKLAESSKKESSQITHHNFIASYLLEESSAKKETKNTESEIKILGQLLQLHKTIIATAIRLL
jgi:hypothetical protein